MKLYEVADGSMGFSYSRCYVLAETEDRAIEIAKATRVSELSGFTYQATLVLDDFSSEFCSEWNDEGFVIKDNQKGELDGS